MSTPSATPPAATRPAARPLVIARVAFAVIVWGASFIATKIALRDVSPITVVWLRFAMGVAVLAAAVAWRGQLALVSRRELATFAVLGFLGVTFHQWLQSNGLVTSQASTTAWIVATTPIFIVILSRLLLGEVLGRRQAAGIGLAVVGVALVISRGDLAALAGGRAGAPGDVLILLSAPNWAVFSVVSRRSLRAHPAARMMLYVMALGWLFLWPLLLAGPGFGDIPNLTRDGWLAIAFLGLLCSGLAYIFWYDALQTAPAAQVGAFLYLEPLVAVGVAAALLGERLYPASWLGGATILVGVWLVNRYAAAARRPG